MPSPPTHLQVLSVAGGVNERNRPWHLQPTQVAANYGWDASIDGQRRRRGGVTPIWGHSSRGQGMFWWNKAQNYNPSTNFLAKNTSIISVNSAGVTVIRGDGTEDPNPPTLTGLTVNGTVDHYFVQGYVSDRAESPEILTPAVFVCNAYRHHTDPSVTSDLFALYQRTNSTWDALGVIDGADVGQEYHPVAMAWLAGRLWVGNNRAMATGATGAVIGYQRQNEWRAGSDIQPSHLYDGARFDHPAISVEPNLGGDITALWPLRGVLPQLLVGKERAIAVFVPTWGSSGAFMQDTDSADQISTVGSRIQILSTKIGIISQRAIVEISGSVGTDILFLASDGHVRSIQRVEQDLVAGAGLPITWNIPDTINRLNLEHARKAVAAVWDNKAFFSVPLDGATTNSHTIVIDLIRGSVLSVEPQGWNELLAVRGFQSDQEREFLFGQYDTQTSDCSFTGSFSGFHLYKVWDENSLIDPSGVDIDCREDSQSFHFGTLRHKKAWTAFSVMTEAATNATGILSISYSCDCDSFTALATLSIAQSQTGVRRLAVKKVGLEDVQPGYTLQFRTESSDGAALSLVYVECSARIIPEETDNEVT